MSVWTSAGGATRLTLIVLGVAALAAQVAPAWAKACGEAAHADGRSLLGMGRATSQG